VHLKAILFDFIGTLVVEKDSHVIHDCFQDAFKENGIALDPKIMRANRGKDKGEMIDILLANSANRESAKQRIYDSFALNIQKNVHRFAVNKGVSELILFLKTEDVKIGLGTGLPRSLFDTILLGLKVNTHPFDYVGIAEELGKGRPHPAMIIDMMERLDIKSGSEFLKLGDTVADIQEGKNAGVLTAAILSGTQTREELEREQPDFLLEVLTDLIPIIKNP
jgi:phosphoglycolate phosphatase-like HAD superfamily hydrolase